MIESFGDFRLIMQIGWPLTTKLKVGGANRLTREEVELKGDSGGGIHNHCHTYYFFNLNETVILP